MRMLILSVIISLGLIRSVLASDYTTLFDPATMTVGQSVGEFLEVKERCPKDSCTNAEKQKYVAAIEGRTGRLEIPVNAGNDFEISFNVWSMVDDGGWCQYYTDFTITLYLSDDTSMPITITRCTELSYQYGESKGKAALNWIRGGINDFRLISEQGILKISSNDTFIDAKINLSGTINRIVVSKINDGEEALYEIRTRGIQASSSTSCPTTSTNATPSNMTGNDCTANFDASTGRLVIPCVAVSVAQPFGGVEISNYNVEMMQRSNSYIFDLDKAQPR